MGARQHRGQTRASCRAGERSALALLFAGLLALLAAAPAQAGYGYRKKITIESDYVDGTGYHVNFPVLINITSDDNLRTTGNGGHVQNANGYDIIFWNTSLTKQLDHEVEEYVATSGKLVAWVRVPVLPTATDVDIYMYYGNSAVSTPTANAAGVWDSNYKAVLHLTEDQSGTGNSNLYQDSTSNNSDGDDQVSATGKTGKISSGQEVDGSDDYIMIDAGINLTGEQTISAWIRADAYWSYNKVVDSQTTSGSGNNQYNLFLDVSGHVESWHSNHCYDSGTTISTSTWYHVAMTSKDGTLKVYVNGTPHSCTQGVPAVTTNYTRIGGRGGAGGHFFDGLIDEVEISNTCRSDVWISTCYNNQSGAVSFYTVNSEQSVSSDPTCTGAFGYRKRIRIDAAQVSGSSGSLTNFPVLVNLSSDNDLRNVAYGGDVENGYGYDIIFRDDTARYPAQLDHEIETYDASTGQLVAWVRIPTLSKSANTDIYIYYGNCEIDSSMEDVPGVWSQNYVGVWHLKEDKVGDSGTADVYQDSTSNNFDGDDYVTATGKSGKIGYGQQFDGGDDYIPAAATGLSDTNTVTLMAWVNFTSVGQYDGILTAREGNFLGLELSGTSPYPQTYAWENTSDEWNAATGLTLSTGTWYFVAVVITPTAATVYRDTSTWTNTKTHNTKSLNKTWRIGCDTSGSGRYLDGYLDEVTISNTNREADWIVTCYNNQSSPSTFYSVNTEETVGVSSPTVVTVIDFAASGLDGRVRITWATAQEVDNLGFRLLRSSLPEGPYEPLAGGWTPGAVSSLVGREYSRDDEDVVQGEPYCYKLAAIDIYGARTEHGPVCVDWGAEDPVFIRGDVNGDGRIDLGDAIAVLRLLYASGSALPCLKAADFDDDGRVDASDPLHGLRYLFAGGQEPPPPAGYCGRDPTEDDVPCDRHPACP